MQNIRQTFQSIISEKPCIRETKAFAHYCQSIALVYLRKKARDGRLDLSVIGLDLTDLAVDCIADLFRRDERGMFPFRLR